MESDKKTELKPHFSKKFLWGASVSTHQVEGGNHNQWSIWELETAVSRAKQAKEMYGHLPMWSEISQQAQTPENYVSGNAVEHYTRYKTDFALAKTLHLTAMRSGIEWSRIEPQEGEFDESALQHYREYFTEMKRQGITPVVTLWHWTFPQWFAEKGGFKYRRNITFFKRYVEYVSKNIGVDFPYIITINEPTVYAAISYHEKRWPPEEHSKLVSLRVAFNLARAHNRVYGVIKKYQPKSLVGIAHNCAYFYPGDNSRISRLVARVGHWFSNEMIIRRVNKKQDFMGLNFYFVNRVLGTKIHNPGDRRNDLGWDMQPEKLRDLLVQLYEKFQKPIMITETGVADMHDQYRKWWIEESIRSMYVAKGRGVKLLGYIHWSLLDNFEWAEGFWPRFGLIAVDRTTQHRTIRASARWYGRVIQRLTATR